MVDKAEGDREMRAFWLSPERRRCGRARFCRCSRVFAMSYAAPVRLWKRDPASTALRFVLPPARLQPQPRPPVYNSFRQFCERLLRIPHDPEPPPGDEAATQIFRAAPNFYKYLLFLWALKSAGVLLIVCVPVGVPLVAAAVALSSQGKHSGWLLLLIPAFVLMLGVIARLFALA